MTKFSKTVFVCQECGSQAPKWLGRCADCGAWNSFVEERPQETNEASGHRYSLAGAAAARLYSEIRLEQHARLSTGINEFDRVLGGGIVPGSLVLLGGEPGIGKSTLLLQAAANMARTVGPVLYSSGEESEHQIKSRGERLAVGEAPLYLLSETCLERILEEIVRIKPALVIVDSVRRRARTSPPFSSGTSRRTAVSPVRRRSSMSSTPCCISKVSGTTRIASFAR